MTAQGFAWTGLIEKQETKLCAAYVFLLINLTLNVCVNVFLYFLVQLHREAKHVLWVTAAGPLNNKSWKLDSKERLKRYYVNFIIHLPRVFLYLTSYKSVSKTGKNQPKNDCPFLFYFRAVPVRKKCPIPYYQQCHLTSVPKLTFVK